MAACNLQVIYRQGRVAPYCLNEQKEYCDYCTWFHPCFLDRAVFLLPPPSGLRYNSAFQLLRADRINDGHILYSFDRPVYRYNNREEYNQNNYNQFSPREQPLVAPLTAYQQIKQELIADYSQDRSCNTSCDCIGSRFCNNHFGKLTVA